MKITNAEYIKSAGGLKDCISHNLAEFAFIGRSNVGKSSLINSLTGRNSLAKTSQKPGKTITINFFKIELQDYKKRLKSWYLVDLPGYGFAQAGAAQREQLRQRIEQYCLNREELTCLFVLIDIRHKPQAIDLQFIEWLGVNGIPFAMVFTKADKLGRETAKRNVEDYKNTLLQTWEELPPIFVTSSQTGDGKEELLNYIDQISEVNNEDQ